MNSINISQKAKNKHLNFSHYEFIINSLIQFNASHPGKRNTGKTQFIKELASTVGTTVSNIYSIIKDATISVRDYNLKVHYELSAMAAFEKRSKNHKIPNNSKFEKSKEFISLVEQEVKSNRLSSIDETINYLKLHQPDIIKNMVIVSTKTFYSYVHQGRTSIKPIDASSHGQKKTKELEVIHSKKDRKALPLQKDPNISRIEKTLEGDLVTGPRDGQNGAYLTLIERKTRHYMIPISAKSSKQVYMQINKLSSFMVIALRISLNQSPLITAVSFFF